MRLAKELGIPNVSRMLRSMSGQDLVEWMAFAELEPFGEERDDLRMAILGAFLGNILYQGFTGNEDAPYEAKDLMPQFGEAAEVMSKEDALLALDALFTGLAAMTQTLDTK